MRLVIISKETDLENDTFDNVEMIEFENQEHLNNGMWLHIYMKNEVFSVSFDPKTEWFNIKK